MKVRLAILLLGFAAPFAARPTRAAGCTDAQGFFAELAQARELDLEIELNAGNLDNTLKALLREAGLETPTPLPALLRMALENSMQHGVEDMFLPSSARIRLQVLRGAAHTEIRITNPLFKEFPKRLERSFSPGESIALSQEERPFPRGFGLGLTQMFRSFAGFPEGARMSWAKNGEKEVTFRLKFPSPSSGTKPATISPR